MPRIAAQWSFRLGTRGNDVPIVKVFNNALWTALRTIFWPKCTRLQDFVYKPTFSIVFFGGSGVLGPRQKVSAWLAGVSIVLDFLNDHCLPQ